MSSTKWRVMADAYGKLGIYKHIAKRMEGACTGWEKIADEDDFDEIRSALKFSDQAISSSPAESSQA